MATQAPPPYTYSAVSQDPEAQLDGDDRDGYKFGATVEECVPEIRAMFVRKVYTVLFLQLLGTAIVAAAMTTAGAVNWVQNK